MDYLDFYPSILKENRKQAKELVVQGKLSPTDFEEIVRIDPSPTKKYTGWLARQWVNKTTSGIQSIDNLRNTIEEYDAFVTSGKAKTKDIFQSSRYLGLSKFTYRDCEGGGKDSAWCTTYKAPDHFHNYYYKQGITFYYIRVKNESIIDALKTAFPSKQGAMVVVALLVNKSGKLSDGYDGTDAQLSAKEIATFRQIVGI